MLTNLEHHHKEGLNPSELVRPALGHFERARHEPAIRFALAVKDATILLAEGNQEKKRDFQKNRFEISSGG
jgi:hypothetical protein